MRAALEKIVRVCQGSKQPTRRIYSILDIALHALGCPLSQRIAAEEELASRAENHLQAYRDRKAAKQLEEVSLSERGTNSYEVGLITRK